MALRRTVEPASEPLTLAEVKTHLRIAASDDDAYLTTLITVARAGAENELQRSLLQQTWAKTLDYFPEAIELPYPPARSVTSIEYVGTDGVTYALDASAYYLDSETEPGWVVPAYGYAWPDTREQANAVTVTYTAGYDDALSIPQAIKQWMLLQIGSMYENREAHASNSPAVVKLDFVDGLLDPFRIVRL